MSELAETPPSATDLPKGALSLAPKDLRGWIWLLVKIATTAGLLVFILSRISIEAFLQRGGQMHVGFAAAALALVIGSITVVAWRWTIVSRAFPPALPLGEATSSLFAAMFAGQILPSSVGVDAVRGWLAARNGRKLAEVISTIAVDRMFGVLGLGCLLLLGAPMLARLGDLSRTSTIVTIAIVMFAAVIGAASAAYLLRDRLARMQSRLVHLASTSARVILSPTGALAFALSLLVQSLLVAAVVLIARGVSVPLSLTGAFATVPAAIFVSMLPFSVNGWGLREGAMILSLGLAGVSEADALFISISYGAALLVASTIGLVPLVLLRAKR